MSAVDSRVDPKVLANLRSALAGRAVLPGDTDYDKLRTVFAGAIDRRPAVIIRVANAADVTHAIGLAGETGLPLSVRSGGHSGAGHSVNDGGIVIDLGDMKGLEIEPRSRTAWAETGLTAVEFTKAAHAHGLAAGFGDTGSVGIGGITLGGGVGYVVRKFGLTIDSLLAADIVTADGQVVRVDDKNNPELFWAIRGGGGNFGVVTRFQLKLQPLKDVYGGMLVLPASAEVIAGFIAAAGAAPDEVSGIANIMPAAPMPFLAEEHHGKLIVMAFMVHAGKTSEGEMALAPFRALATPLADMLKVMPYPEIYPPDDPNYRPLAASRTMFIDRVDGAVAGSILEHLRAAPVQFAVTQLRVLGGAMSRVPVDATAFAHRHSKMMVNLAALYTEPGQKNACETWVAKFMTDLRQSDGGAYVNFLGDEGPERVRAAYPGATWDRLRAIKKKYDPTNLFRLNQNIPAA